MTIPKKNKLPDSDFVCFFNVMRFRRGAVIIILKKKRRERRNLVIFKSKFLRSLIK